MKIYYVIDFWHTDKREWYEYGHTDEVQPERAALTAEALYQQALGRHYAKTVRIRKVTEEVIKQSQEPTPALILPEGVTAVGLGNPAELHNAIKDAVGE